jgi:hypothetical protein
MKSLIAPLTQTATLMLVTFIPALEMSIWWNILFIWLGLVAFFLIQDTDSALFFFSNIFISTIAGMIISFLNIIPANQQLNVLVWNAYVAIIASTIALALSHKYKQVAAFNTLFFLTVLGILYSYDLGKAYDNSIWIGLGHTFIWLLIFVLVYIPALSYSRYKSATIISGTTFALAYIQFYPEGYWTKTVLCLALMSISFVGRAIKQDEKNSPPNNTHSSTTL